MLYLACILISSVDLAHYRVPRAEDWVFVDCGTMYTTFTIQRILKGNAVYWNQNFASKTKVCQIDRRFKEVTLRQAANQMTSFHQEKSGLRWGCRWATPLICLKLVSHG